MTDVMHRDMNFILAFMTVYGYHAMVVVFVSPAFGSSPGAFLAAALEPASTIGVAIMHQTSIWHRFRECKPAYDCCSCLSWLLCRCLDQEGV